VLHRLAGAALLALLVVPTWGLNAAFAEPIPLTILHTNDTHAHLETFDSQGLKEVGGIARRATLIKQVKQSEPAVLVLVSGPSGRLEISRHALHRLVEACCEQLKGVASARAVISQRGNRLRTVIRLKVRPDAKLDAIQGYLSEEIAGIYRDNLAFKGEVGPIEIKVIGVVPESEATF
jgi:hypothetical protein